MSKSLGNLVFVSDLLKVADPRAIRLALMRHHYRAGFEWYDTDLDEGTALLHRLLAAAERTERRRPAPVRGAGARRDRRRPRRADGARGARRPRQRGPLGRRRRRARRPCCASSARCSASTSTGRVERRTALTRYRPGSSDERPLVPSPAHGSARSRSRCPTARRARYARRDHRRARSRRRSARGLAKAALAAKVDGEWCDLDRPLDHDAAVAIVAPDTPRRPRGAAALHRARDGAGRHRPVPGRASTRSGPRSPTASTTTSSSPTARTSPRTTSSASRRGCARSWRPTSRSSARRSTATRAHRRCSPTSRTSSRSSSGSTPTTRRRSARAP